MPKFRDLVGMKFGRLLIKERFYPDWNKDSTVYWLCECDCSNTTIGQSRNIVAGRKRSCGCLPRGRKKGASGIGSVYWNRLLRHSRDRGLEFDLDPKYLWNLYQAQGGLCAYSGVPLSLDFKKTKNSPGNASLDRIDSSRGYVRGNVQWVDRKVNRMKSDLGEAEFLDLCRKIARRRRA